MNGPYALGILAKALSSLEKLNPRLRRRVRDRIEALAATPRPPGCVKLAGQATFWRIRVGDYRVIYEIDDAARSVVVVIVAHRRESYRGL